MKCICGKETGSDIKKTCSGKCRTRLSRTGENKRIVTLSKDVTLLGGIVTDSLKSVTEEVKCYNEKSVTDAKSESVTDYDSEFLNNPRLRDDWKPREVSTVNPPLVAESWREETRAYKQLIYNLENMSIKELKEKNYWIPAWKYIGISKRPKIKEVLGLAGGLDKKELSDAVYGCGCKKTEFKICPKHRRA